VGNGKKGLLVLCTQVGMLFPIFVSTDSNPLAVSLDEEYPGKGSLIG
jgi:hypothetical protein